MEDNSIGFWFAKHRARGLKARRAHFLLTMEYAAEAEWQAGFQAFSAKSDLRRME